MFTYNFFVNKNRGDALSLRIYSKGRKTELTLGLYLSESELETALSSDTRAGGRFRPLLLHWIAEIEDLKIELLKQRRSSVDVREIRDLIKNTILGKEETESAPTPAPPAPKIGTFKPFFIAHKDGYDKRSTRESNEYTLSVMEKFCGQDGRADLDTLDFEDINYAWLADLDKFMERSGLSQNTRRIHFANIRAAINDAYRRELTDADPFRRFRLKSEKTAKRSLPVEELRKLFDYEPEPHAVYYRDMFKLIFMLIGINTVDLYGLKEISKEGRIEYRRAKTGRLYSIRVEPEAMALIEKYRGVSALLNIADKYKDHRYFRRDTNDALRRIGKVTRSGRGGKKSYEPLWPDISTYWARHTWATLAAELDIPDATISLALGHAGENRVTDIYIRRNQKKVDEANRRVLDWVLYGRR